MFVAGALLLSRLPEYARGTVHAERALIRVAEAWYVIWPALALSLAGATAADVADWPVFLAALASPSTSG